MTGSYCVGRPWDSELAPSTKGETMGAHAAAIRNYIRAKDENRPHLMLGAFASDASLEMKVKLQTSPFRQHQRASKRSRRS
jgi:hypothetical protein